ncbi:Protein translocase subunit, partial [Frankliniella fusca]
EREAVRAGPCPRVPCCKQCCKKGRQKSRPIHLCVTGLYLGLLTRQHMCMSAGELPSRQAEIQTRYAQVYYRDVRTCLVRIRTNMNKNLGKQLEPNTNTSEITSNEPNRTHKCSYPNKQLSN